MKIKKMMQFIFLLLISTNAFSENKTGFNMKKVEAPKASIEKMKELSPDFAKLTDEILFKELWNRPGLSPRDKSFDLPLLKRTVF